MIPVPARQLHQLIQDPPLPDPVTGPVGLGQVLRDGLALSQRQSHPSRMSAADAPGAFPVRQRTRLRGGFMSQRAVSLCDLSVSTLTTSSMYRHLATAPTRLFVIRTERDSPRTVTRRQTSLCSRRTPTTGGVARLPEPSRWITGHLETQCEWMSSQNSVASSMENSERPL
jgi:hypothetical protein